MGLGVPCEADLQGPPGDRRAPAEQKYGIHGTCNPSAIGRHVTMGCIRLHNEEIIELYERVPVGTPVVIVP